MARAFRYLLSVFSRGSEGEYTETDGDTAAAWLQLPHELWLQRAPFYLSHGATGNASDEFVIGLLSGSTWALRVEAVPVSALSDKTLHAKAWASGKGITKKALYKL